MQIKTYLLCQWFNSSSGSAPFAPTNPDITDPSTAANIVVTWTNPTTPGTTNEVWKSADGITFVLFSTVGGGVSQATDATGLAVNTFAYYKIRSCNGASCSAFSSTVSAVNSYVSPNVAAISFPTLVRAFGGTSFQADGLAALISVSLPKLRKVDGNLDLANNPNMTTVTLTVLATVNSLFLGSNKLTGVVTLPALTTAGGDIQIFANTLITSFSAPVLQTIGGNWTSSGCTGCTSISMPNLSGVSAQMDFASCTAMTSVNLNSLLNISGPLIFTSCTALVNLSLPTLNTMEEIGFESCTLLQSVSAPNLVNAAPINIFSIDGQNCPALTTISMPNIFFVVDGFTYQVSGCALNAASINQILARGVASGVTSYDFELAGGTNAAPSGQGVIDKATLIGLGNTVNTN